MKKIILTAYQAQGERVEQVFKEYNVPFYKERVNTNEKNLLEFTSIAPDDTARTILEILANILDTRHKEIMITSQTLDAAFSDYLLDLEQKENTSKTGRLAEEFHTLAEPSVEFNKDLFAMVIIASVVAVVGLFTNNAALVIGGMLLAPLIGPITAFSFNVAIAKPKKMMKASVNGFVLLLATFSTAFLITIISSQFIELSVTNEILLRTENSFVFLALAIALGLAGGIAMSSNVPGILVGVAIAAALVPPTAVTGIGLALGNFDIFNQALVLTASNVIGLILGMMIIFFVKNITPRKYHQKEKGKKYIIITISLFIIMSVIVAVLTF